METKIMKNGISISILETTFYKTGEVRKYLENLGLPSSKIWLANILKKRPDLNKLFIRPNDGYRYIYGENLVKFIEAITSA
jgi:hypothetical protein